MKPKHITFTGIDARTDLVRADYLARKYPIEWGLLFSIKNGDCRYTSNQLVKEVLAINGRKSAHLCGKYFKDIYFTQRYVDLPIYIDEFDIIQVNGVKDASKAEMMSFYFGVPIILQTQQRFFENHINSDKVRFLYDCSGGKGIDLDYVPSSMSGSIVGYAGGLGPGKVDNLVNQIPGDGDFWIDMETHVRTNEWFDLDKVERVCIEVYGEI